jgi:rare lipoprotein A
MLPILIAFFLFAALGTAAQDIDPTQKNPSAQLPLSTIGWASWYGWQFHGRTTANGETYDMDALTAAHRTLAFGTVVRVFLLDNDSNVTVRINDRGPFVDDRIIDLSRAAAKTLGMMRTGIARVRLEIISVPPPPRYVLQLGAFRNRENAESLSGRLSRHQIPVRMELAGDIIRVVTEPTREDDLPAVEAELRKAGISDWLRRRSTSRECGKDPSNDDAEQSKARTTCPEIV